jgi:sporulation protein YtfJ
MEEHPIQGLMQTAMENLKEMVDVNTIIGEPVETATGQLIIPVSKVGFGFAAGGSEFQVGHKKEERQNGHGKGDHGSDQGQEVSCSVYSRWRERYSCVKYGENDSSL